jgi:hypothetical protein
MTRVAATPPALAQYGTTAGQVREDAYRAVTAVPINTPPRPPSALAEGGLVVTVRLPSAGD